MAGDIKKAGAVPTSQSPWGPLLSDSPPPLPPKPPTGANADNYESVPKGFLWGAGTAAYQVEKGLHNTDWNQWEHSKQWWFFKTANGEHADDGADFAHINADGSPGGHFKEYLAAAKAMGQNSFYFTIDWSRVQPTKDGPYDPNGLRLYHAILDECKKDGLEPLVVLDHFTLPLWVYNPKHPDQSLGGWTGHKGDAPDQAPIIASFAKFCGDMAKEYGKDVKYWIPEDEPVGEALSRYGLACFPGPGHTDLKKMFSSVITMAYAHAAAYDAIHANQTDAKVGICQALRAYEPYNLKSSADIKASEQIEYQQNALFLDALTQGDADWNADGKFTGKYEGKGIAALKNKLDWIGVNYYTYDRVKAFPFGLKLPLGDYKLRGYPFTEIPKIGYNGDPRQGVDPDGLYRILMWTQNRYHLPMMVTENGHGESENAPLPDVKRPASMIDHIEQMQRAMKDGANVNGYQYWSLMDTFEWQEGFASRYGLLRVNYDDPKRSFAWTEGAKAYKDIIGHGGVKPEVRKDFPYDPYLHD